MTAAFGMRRKSRSDTAAQRTNPRMAMLKNCPHTPSAFILQCSLPLSYLMLTFLPAPEISSAICWNLSRSAEMNAPSDEKM